MVSEIKIFSRLDRLRNERAGNALANMFTPNHDIETMPFMLAFKSNHTVGEIMMTHGGNNLHRWLDAHQLKSERAHFAADFLRQSIMAIKTLHSFGYSHGDLKPENVCVLELDHGNYKFTLIDFGLCVKLVEPGDPKRTHDFRGNLMFSSDQQIKKGKPTRYCDLLALLNMAYFIIYEEVPASEAAQEQLWRRPNLFNPPEYTQFRLQNIGKFDQKLCDVRKNPFSALC